MQVIALSILPCFRYLAAFTEWDTQQFESVTQDIDLVIEHNSAIQLSVQLSVFETLGDINNVFLSRQGEGLASQNNIEPQNATCI